MVKATAMGLGMAARFWCDKRTETRVMDVALATVIAEKLDEFAEALLWASARADFQVGGQARKGYEKLIKPLLEDYLGYS